MNREPTAKKVRGEVHWLPAVKGKGGPVPIAWTKHPSAHAAKAEAAKIMSSPPAA